MIRYHAIDLLRHSRPIATKTSLDMGERDAHFGAHSGAREGRVGVAIERIQSGASAARTGSSRLSISPVCAPWLPEPTPRS